MDILWLAAAAAFFGLCRGFIKLLDMLPTEE
jgi:hypothetical protein